MGEAAQTDKRDLAPILIARKNAGKLPLPTMKAAMIELPKASGG